MEMEAGLDNLPQELLAAVIEEVDDSRTLYTLLRCSLRLYNITLPRLYRNIVLHQYQEKHKKRSNYHYIHRLYDFTCQILRNSQAATSMRTFTVVHKWRPHRIRNRGILEESLDGNVSQAISHGYNDAEKACWLKEMAGCRDAAVLLGVLLPRLPCLARADIALRSPYIPFNHYLGNGASSILHLTLSNITFALTGELSPFILGCQHLRTLELGWIEGKSFWHNQPGSCLKELDEVLRTLSGTLEHLALHYEKAGPTELPENIQGQGHLKSLRRCIKLKSLKVGMAFAIRYPIFGLQIHYLASPPQVVVQSLAKMLPPALEDLHLTRRAGEYLALLLDNIKEVMISVSNGRFRFLRSITVENEIFAFEYGPSLDPKRFPKYAQSAIAELEERGRELSIELRWVTRFLISWSHRVL